MWRPEIDFEADGPLYRTIADALARDIGEGRLRVGDRLPTHRDLAELLGVNVGTVTRAYAEAGRRGLVDGEVGRGTYVRAQRRFEPLPLAPETENRIDLSFNVPSGGASDAVKAKTLAEIGSECDLSELFDHYQGLGVDAHRAAGAEWIGRSGLTIDPERVAQVGGAQHAMAICLSMLAQPGELIVTEALTYPGIKSLAGALGLRLVGLEMDADGIVPDAFEHICRTSTPRVLYLMTNLQNPTGIIVSAERRAELASVARRHGVAIVEDDTYGFLSEEDVPPLASFAPELTWFITSTSKSLAAGLRVGWILAPTDTPRAMQRIAGAVAALGWMTSPLCAEITARWIRDGVADAIVAEKRAEARTRRGMAESALGPLDTPSHAGSCHVWWNLPEPWRANELAHQAAVAGVAVSPPELFAVGRRPVPHAVRVCLGTPQTRTELEEGLALLGGVLRGCPSVGAAIV